MRGREMKGGIKGKVTITCREAYQTGTSENNDKE